MLTNCNVYGQIYRGLYDKLDLKELESGIEQEYYLILGESDSSHETYLDGSKVES